MNREDFRRNFAQSYFGLQPSVLKGRVNEEFWNQIELIGSLPLIPCTTPVFPSGSVVRVNAIIKTSGNEIINMPIDMPWAQDDDENTSIMHAQHPQMLGMVHTKDSVAYIKRYPHRQYNRGYTPRSCTSWVPNSYSYGGDGIPATDPYVVWHVFNPQSYPWYEAVDILESGARIGVVLGPWLAMYTDQGKKYPRLAYRNDTIGFVQNREPVVYQESSEIARDYIYKITGKIPKVK